MNRKCVMNKKTYRALILSFMVCIVLFAPGCNRDYIKHPPISTVTVEDVSEYPKTNGFIDSWREENEYLRGVLPDTVDPGNITRYLYWYRNDLITTPQADYGILLKTAEMDSAEIQAEMERLSKLEAIEKREGEDGVLFIASYDPNWSIEMLLYFDTYEDCYSSFALAEFTNDNTITYMEVLLYDGRMYINQEIEETAIDIVLRYTGEDQINEWNIAHSAHPFVRVTGDGSR